MAAAWSFLPWTTINVRTVDKETSQILAKKINIYPDKYSIRQASFFLPGWAFT